MISCDLLGVSVDDRDQSRGWSDALLSTTACTPAESAAAAQAMADHFAAPVSQRLHQPTDDLLGALVQTWDPEEGAAS